SVVIRYNEITSSPTALRCFSAGEPSPAATTEPGHSAGEALQHTMMPAPPIRQYHLNALQRNLAQLGPFLAADATNRVPRHGE
ncbi:hydrolase, partial [Staphylococcus pseudintermedius]